MIFFCEINKTGFEHATANKQLLALLARTFPGSVIQARISQSHWQAISDGVDTTDIEPLFEEVIAPETGNKWRWISKLLNECKRAFAILRAAQNKKVKLVFFASSSPLGNLFISLLSRFVFKKCKVVITLHGELQLLRSRGGKAVDRVYALCLRKAFSMKVTNQRYLILDKYICDRLLAYGLIPSERVMAIRHPLTHKQLSPNEPIPEKKVVFGHLGVAKVDKHSPLFFDLARRFQSEVSKGLASFVVAGQVLDEMLPFTNQWVEYSEAGELLTNDAYLARCKGMQYAVFFYDDKGYELISSGAIMDAISFGIPIIGLRNPYFTHLFEQCQIPPGILCDDFNGFCEVVRKLITTDEYNYEQMKTGMRLLKSKFDFGQIQVDFSSQLHGFLN